MEDLKLNYKIVDIDKLVANSWNPKKENPKAFAEVVKSINTYGLKSPILVRDMVSGYEIVDGFHRWMAAKQLGYKKIIINDLGKVSDDEAKRLTIAFQKVQVPFDDEMYADLLKQLDKNIGDEEIFKTLPIDAKELSDILNKSSAESIREIIDTGEGKIKKEEIKRGEVNAFTLMFDEQQLGVVMEAINKCKIEAGEPKISNSRAIELISADYMGT